MPEIRSVSASRRARRAPDGFVLWTRLAPEPLSSNPATPGGHERRRRHRRLRDRDRSDACAMSSGAARQPPSRRSPIRCISMSRGLQPGRPYWYRFLSGDAVEPDRARHRRCRRRAPPLERLRFGFVSCANYEHGYFSAYRHLTDENPEVVAFPRRLHLRTHRGTPSDRAPPQRRHRGGDAADLSQSLCAISARSGSAAPARRGAGARHLGRPRRAERLCRQMVAIFRRSASSSCCGGRRPTRRSTSTCRCVRSCRGPNGPVMRVYDRFTFGDLIEISLIDGRQYRSREACYAPPRQRRRPSRNQCRVVRSALRGRPHHARLCPGGLALPRPRAHARRNGI